jgi:hypothetical protein
MANWTVSDQLDARLRDRLGDDSVSRYVETLIADQLNYDDDQTYRSQVDAQMAASEADIAAGRVEDARRSMSSIAARKGIHTDR